MIQTKVDYTYLGSNIRKKRFYLNMTQEALANLIGVSVSFIGHIERGSRIAGVETLARLSIALSEPLDSLVLPPEHMITSKFTNEQRKNARKLLEYALNAVKANE